MNPLSLHNLVPEHVRRFEPYTPSRPDPVLMRMYGVEHLHRLNNNENALGPPDAARKAIEAFHSERAAVYPSGDCFLLREALADRFGKLPEQFLVGNGSCEVITSVIKAFCGPGDNIVTADKTFAVYEWVAEFSGFEARLTPLREHAFDPEAMLAAMDARTKVAFVCNPNNPTGTYWSESELCAFMDAVDNRCIVVVDEAYLEYVDKPDFPDGMRLMERYPNLVVFRTFSKMYGLAALRIGYLCASQEVVDIVRRTHIVYSVNTQAQTAAAAAIADDAEHIAATRRMVAEGRAVLEGCFSRLGLEFVSGEGNYVMARAPLSDTLLYRKLMKRGYMVRTMTGFRFPNWIRVSLVHRPVLEGFCRALEDVLRG